LSRAIQILRQNKCIVIVISHRPSVLAALNMAMVLYEGRVIAFGPRQEVFARVRNSTAPPAMSPVAQAPRYDSMAEGALS
jgi:ABC-type protease/lipase transport system fused ATPase/permease subunit